MLALGASASACTFGMQSFQAPRSRKALNLDGTTGTADVSVRWTQLQVAGYVQRPRFTVDFGMGLGTRYEGFESPDGALTTLPERESPSGFSNRGIYDAYFAGVMVPVSGVQDLDIGVYGRASLTGLGRLVGGRSSSKYNVEAGVEVNLPSLAEENIVYARAGLLLEPSLINADEPTIFDGLNGDVTYFGATITIGVRFGR